jgi:serine/threonine-protein kinase
MDDEGAIGNRRRTRYHGPLFRMSLAPGTRLGVYEVVSSLGAGGMGEVYRARDTELNRSVAIKVLPGQFALDHERLTRFSREAQTLAALNHPNIAQIYGLERDPSSPDARGLVMELVEGEDLSTRLARGALPLAEALSIARQIADALETAHEAGIIHRDLKPANIKVRPDGTVKILDFGLAKAVERADAAANPASSPTMLTGTIAGLILGTAGYMAPEQARGQPVDRRADIWAFGVVLFEMLSGKPAFTAETVSDVLASVLKNDLDWTALPKDLPAPIAGLLRRCLTADRRERLRDIGEARIAISEFLTGKSVVESGTAPRPRRSRQRAVWTVAAAGFGAVATLAAFAIKGSPPSEGTRRFVVSPPEGASAHAVSRPSISLAADGWTLAFVGFENGAASLYVRGPTDFEPRKLPATNDASHPVFAPDGKSVAFFAENRLRVMPLDSAPRPVASVNDPRGLCWVDGETLVYTPESIGGLMELPSIGGSPRAITTIDEQAGERTHRWPSPLPGGRWVLFTVGTTNSPDDYDNSRIDAVDRVTGERRAVYQNASAAAYAPTGHLVFARSGSLWAIPFDRESLKISGTPKNMVQGVGGDRTTGAAHVAWADTGTLAYVPGDVRQGFRHLVWADLKGAHQSIPLRAALWNDLRISPDGTRVALADNTTGSADIWVYRFDRGTFTRLTFTTVNATPVWSADGRELFFSAIDRGGRGSSVFRVNADGGRDPVPVTTLDGRIYLKHISADGSWALVDYLIFGGARANIGRVVLRQGATVEPLVDTRADEYGAALSPDGRFVAYQADESGTPEVFVRELAGFTGRWQVSNAGGEEPMWSPDGRSIFYRFNGRLMRVPVETHRTFTVGPPAQLFEGVFNLRSDTGVSYQPHPDGSRLLMTRPADALGSGSIRIVTRWFDELKTVR